MSYSLDLEENSMSVANVAAANMTAVIVDVALRCRSPLGGRFDNATKGQLKTFTMNSEQCTSGGHIH